MVFDCHCDGDEIRGDSMSRTIVEKLKLTVCVREGGGQGDGGERDEGF